MNGDETCTCGHVFDEHTENEPHVCLVMACDCLKFEDGEDEAEGDEVEEL